MISLCIIMNTVWHAKEFVKVLEFLKLIEISIVCFNRMSCYFSGVCVSVVFLLLRQWIC